MKFWIFQVGLVIFFTTLFLVSIDTYELLTREDNIVEYSTFIFYLISGVLYFKIGLRNTSINKSLFLVLAIGCWIVAGEEVSWFQRILNFETPDNLQSVNDQNEFNFHNIDKKFFDQFLIWIVIGYLFIWTYIKIASNKFYNTLILPGIEIGLCFILAIFYQQYNDGLFNFHLLTLPILLYWLYYANKRKDFSLMIIIGFTFIIISSTAVLHILFQEKFPVSNNSANEIREFLISYTVLASAMNILKK